MTFNTDKQFLWWIHDRLINVHKEHICTDYMYRLRSIISTLPDDQSTRVDFTANSIPKD